MYTLLKIDLIDANIHADIYDAGRYQTIAQEMSLERILDTAVDEFFKANPSYRSWEEWEQRGNDGAYEFEIFTDEPSSIFRGSILLKEHVMSAISLARKYHGGRKRKGDNLEYLIHILEITRLLDKKGFEDEVIAAAFCHDLLEDTECTTKEIEMACGKETLRIVKAVTNDQKLDKRADWEKKKEKYIQSVMKGGEKAIAVCIADKIVNLKSLIKAFEKEGPTIWARFNRGKKQKLWFERSVLKVAKQNWKNPLLKEYAALIEEMKGLRIEREKSHRKSANVSKQETKKKYGDYTAEELDAMDPDEEADLQAQAIVDTLNDSTVKDTPGEGKVRKRRVRKKDGPTI